MGNITFNGRNFAKVSALPVGEASAQYIKELVAVRGSRGACAVITTRLNGTRFIQYATDGRTEEER